MTIVEARDMTMADVLPPLILKLLNERADIGDSEAVAKKLSDILMEKRGLDPADAQKEAASFIRREHGRVRALFLLSGAFIGLL